VLLPAPSIPEKEISIGFNIAFLEKN